MSQTPSFKVELTVSVYSTYYYHVFFEQFHAGIYLCFYCSNHQII